MSDEWAMVTKYHLGNTHPRKYTTYFGQSHPKLVAVIVVVVEGQGATSKFRKSRQFKHYSTRFVVSGNLAPLFLPSWPCRDGCGHFFVMVKSGAGYFFQQSKTPLSLCRKTIKSATGNKTRILVFR